MSNTKTIIKNPALIIMKRELLAYFTSPVAYIVMGLFLAFSGFLFFSLFFLMNRAELRQFFVNLPLLFAFFIPAITMRLFAEEQKTGTMETLMTLPVSTLEVVTGKFLAALKFSVIMLVPTISYAITASIFGSLDVGATICGYIGAVLLAAAFCAVGIFASSITKNQIVAFFVAFTICILLAMVDQFLLFLPSGAVNFFQFLSAGSHFTSISRGIIDSRDIIYFASVIALFFTLTVKTLNAQKGAA